MEQQDVRESVQINLYNNLQWRLREFSVNGINTLEIDEQFLVTIKGGEVYVAPYTPPAPVIEYVEVPVQVVEAAPELVIDTNEPAPEEWPAVEADAEPIDASAFDVPVNVTPVSRSRRNK